MAGCARSVMEDGGKQSGGGGRPEGESESYNARARRAEVWPERKLRSGGCMGMAAAVCEHGGATKRFGSSTFYYSGLRICLLYFFFENTVSS